MVRLCEVLLEKWENVAAKLKKEGKSGEHLFCAGGDDDGKESFGGVWVRRERIGRQEQVKGRAKRVQ